MTFDSDAFVDGGRLSVGRRIGALTALGTWLEGDSSRVTVDGCLSWPVMEVGADVEHEATAMTGNSNVCSAFPEMSATCATALRKSGGAAGHHQTHANTREHKPGQPIKQAHERKIVWHLDTSAANQVVLGCAIPVVQRHHQLLLLVCNIKNEILLPLWIVVLLDSA